MSDFFESKLPVNVSRRKISQIREVKLYWSSPDPDFYVTVPCVVSPKMVNLIKLRIEQDLHQLFPKLSFNFNILSLAPLLVDDKEISKNPKNFFKRNMINVSDYIREGSRVMCVGRSVLPLSNYNLTTYSFYDFVFNKTHFFNPDLKSVCYPVDEASNWSFFDKKIKEETGMYQIQDTFERRFFLLQLKKMVEDSKQIDTVVDYPEIEIVTDFDSFIAEHRDEKIVAIDTETSGLDFTKDRVGCVTIAFNSAKGYYLSWDIINCRKFSIWVKDKFQIYQNGKFDIKMLTHQGINRNSLYIDHDTTQGGHLLNEMRSNSLKSQAWIYTPWGGYDKELEDYKAKYRPKSYLDIPEPILSKYATWDASVTFRIYEEQIKQIAFIDEKFPNEWFPNNDLRSLLYDRVFPALNAFTDIEYEGAYINVDKLREVSEYFLSELETKRKEVLALFGLPSEFNLESPTELGRFLEASPKNYPDVGRVASGNYSTDDSALHEWLRLGYKEFEDLISYKSVSTIVKMFTGREKELSGMWQHIRYHNDGTARVHPSFAVFLKVSLRNGCDSPNLQQIPKHGIYAEKVRSIFSVPSEEYYIAELDGKGYQLRIGAALSGDKNLISAFTDPLIKGDVHSLTTRNIFKPDMDMTDFLEELKTGNKDFSALRHKGKQANLSLEFGSSGFAFAVNTLYSSWSVEEIEHYIEENHLRDNVKKLVQRSAGRDEVEDDDKSKFKKSVTVDEKFCKYWAVGSHIRDKFFEAYPELKTWIDSMPMYGERRGFVRSVHGAIRRLPQLLLKGASDKNYIVKGLQNISINSPVQAFENIIMSGEVVAGLWKWLKDNNMKSRIWAMVHDSVVLYLHRDEVDVVVTKAKEIFERDRPEHFGVPMELEVSLSDYSKGEYWGFGREIE